MKSTSLYAITFATALFIVPSTGLTSPEDEEGISSQKISVVPVTDLPAIDEKIENENTLAVPAAGSAGKKVEASEEEKKAEPTLRQTIESTWKNVADFAEEAYEIGKGIYKVGKKIWGFITELTSKDEKKAATGKAKESTAEPAPATGETET